MDERWVAKVARRAVDVMDFIVVVSDCSECGFVLASPSKVVEQ